MTMRDNIVLSQAHSRLYRRPMTTVTISMQKGQGETDTASIRVPDDALTSGDFGFGVADLIKDAFKVRIIQVWVECYVNGKKTTETLFVPLLEWHMLSVYWQMIIEDYVKEKLFDSPENQSAPLEKKRTGSYLICYRRNGDSGESTRKERFHDWWVGFSGRGKTIFNQRYYTDWKIPMPSVKPPAHKIATT